MPRLFVPPLLRSLTDGLAEVEVSGHNVGAAVDELETRFPGVRERIFDGPRVKPGLAIVVDGNATSKGRLQPLEATSEIHVLPAIGGG